MTGPRVGFGAARKGRPVLSLPLLAVLTASVFMVAAMLAPSGVSAHEGSHPYESLVAGVEPAGLGDGLEIRILDFDRKMELVNRTGRPVTVIGYEGEPYGRIDPDGSAWINALSPSVAPSHDRMGTTEPSGLEDADAPPDWVKVADDGTFRWHDRRTQWRREGDPPGLVDPEQRQQLRQWRVPILVGDRPATIDGTLYWTGRKPFPNGLLIFLLLSTAATAGFGLWVLNRNRREDGQPG